MSQADIQQEFQDATNDLKIRILDLVDQISSMYTDRASYEHHQKQNQIAQVMRPVIIIYFGIKIVLPRIHIKVIVNRHQHYIGSLSVVAY